MTGACVVDSGYDGEIFVNLHNSGMSIEHVRSGQKIDIISDGYKMPGTYNKIWNGASYPSGIYFVQIKFWEINWLDLEPLCAWIDLNYRP